MRECKDTHAAARAAMAEIETRSQGVEQAIGSTQSDVERAARAVLWLEAQMRVMVAGARLAQQAYVEKVVLAKFLHDQALWPYPKDDPGATELRRVCYDVETPSLHWTKRPRGRGPDREVESRARRAANQRKLETAALDWLHASGDDR